MFNSFQTSSSGLCSVSLNKLVSWISTWQSWKIFQSDCNLAWFWERTLPLWEFTDVLSVSADVTVFWILKSCLKFSSFVFCWCVKCSWYHFCEWRNDGSDSKRRFGCDRGNNDWHCRTETEGNTDDRRGWRVWRIWDRCVMMIDRDSFLLLWLSCFAFLDRMGRKRRRRRGQETVGRWLGRWGVGRLCESAEVSCEQKPLLSHLRQLTTLSFFTHRAELEKQKHWFSFWGNVNHYAPQHPRDTQNTTLRVSSRTKIITWVFFSFTIKVCFCASAKWQRATHTVSEEKGGDYRATASSQGVLSEGWKREKEGGFWLVDGVEVSVMACFINSCQCQPIHPSLVLEGQSCVYHSQCVIVSSISLLVLACFVKCACAQWCVDWGVWWGMHDQRCLCVVVKGDLWDLWLVVWLCHPHVCLFVIHRKRHSPHMPTFCCTTPNGWQEGLMTYHHALVGWFCDHSSSFPATTVSSSFSNHPFFSRPLLHGGCFEMLLWNVFDYFNKHFIFFLPIPVFVHNQLCGLLSVCQPHNLRRERWGPIPVLDCLKASIPWNLDGTVFLLDNCLCDIVWCIMHIPWCGISWIRWMNVV